MAYEDLEKALQEIDPGDFIQSAGRVILQQQLPGEADSLARGLEEYPSLFAGVNALPVITRDPAAGMGEAEALTFESGFASALAALKVMIDTARLNDIPMSPTIE